jgi:Domain of unknown function (DUF4411)
VQRFWLDANVFIEAKRRYYAFDLAPGFWTVLEQQCEAQVIKSPFEVFRELADSGDDLTEWAKAHRDGDLFVEPDDVVQAALRDIADFVTGTYIEAAATRFLDGADPWVIAHAQCDKGTVVTVETMAGAGSARPKIPNICREFDVQCIDTFAMLRELGVLLILKGSSR